MVKLQQRFGPAGFWDAVREGEVFLIGPAHKKDERLIRVSRLNQA